MNLIIITYFVTFTIIYIFDFDNIQIHTTGRLLIII